MSLKHTPEIVALQRLLQPVRKCLVVPIVILELRLGNVERQVLSADFVEAAK